MSETQPFTLWSGLAQSDSHPDTQPQRTGVLLNRGRSVEILSHRALLVRKSGFRVLQEDKGRSARAWRRQRILRHQRRAHEGMWQGAKPRRNVPSKFGSQYPQAKYSCHFTLVKTLSLNTHPSISLPPSLPGLEWEDGELGGGRHKIRASW